LAEEVLVHANLVCDQVEAVAEPVDLGDQPVLMLAENGEAVRLGAGSAPDQGGVPADLGERHPGGAEPDAVGQPLHVVLGVDATAVGRAHYRGDQDAFAFVEAQRVHAEPGARRNLPDAQACGGGVHERQDTG
jgi:hypothetical protein